MLSEVLYKDCFAFVLQQDKNPKHNHYGKNPTFEMTVLEMHYACVHMCYVLRYYELYCVEDCRSCVYASVPLCTI